ncbi:MAG: YraN family protein [Anaerolineaceae bacterium]|nr:YraN family protein [Anaerolineaceae bacterium]
MTENKTYQQQVGRQGEDLAADYLQKQGYQLLDRNYLSRFGEVDLVAVKDEVIVFVEVKARTNDRFGLPEASVTPEKLEKIYDTALFWLQEHPEMPDDWRVDVIAIQLDKAFHVQDIQHFINID